MNEPSLEPLHQAARLARRLARHLTHYRQAAQPERVDQLAFLENLAIQLQKKVESYVERVTRQSVRPLCDLKGTRRCFRSGSPVVKITAGNRLKSYRTARSALPAVGLDPAGPYRRSGKTGSEWRDSRAPAGSTLRDPGSRLIVIEGGGHSPVLGLRGTFGHGRPRTWTNAAS